MALSHVHIFGRHFAFKLCVLCIQWYGFDAVAYCCHFMVFCCYCRFHCNSFIKVYSNILGVWWYHPFTHCLNDSFIHELISLRIILIMPFVVRFFAHVHSNFEADKPNTHNSGVFMAVQLKMSNMNIWHFVMSNKNNNYCCLQQNSIV